MLMVHIFGGVVAAIGLFLFVADQWSPEKRGGDDSAIKAWKIELSGPAPLVLIFLGIGVFLFPFWVPSATPSPEGTTSTVTEAPISAVSVEIPTTSGFPDFSSFPSFAVPAMPNSWWVAWEPNCEDNAVFWDDYGDADYWIVPVATLDGSLRASETEIYSDFPFLCFWEFHDGLHTNYWLWPYGVNEAGFGESLWIDLIE